MLSVMMVCKTFIRRFDSDPRLHQPHKSNQINNPLGDLRAQTEQKGAKGSERERKSWPKVGPAQRRWSPLRQQLADLLWPTKLACLYCEATERFWFALSRLVPTDWWNLPVKFYQPARCQRPDCGNLCQHYFAYYRPSNRVRIARWVFDQHNAAGNRLHHRWKQKLDGPRVHAWRTRAMLAAAAEIERQGGAA